MAETSAVRCASAKATHTRWTSPAARGRRLCLLLADEAAEPCFSPGRSTRCERLMPGGGCLLVPPGAALSEPCLKLAHWDEAAAPDPQVLDLEKDLALE